MKKNKILIFIVIVTAIVAVIRTVSAQNQVKQLKREEYGGSDREYSLVMEKDGRDCEVNLTVNPKIPDEAGLNKMFEDTYENILTKIMGGNNSLSEVTENLDFTYNTESGITIQYFLDDYSVINGFGEVNNKSLQSPEKVDISVELRYEDKYKTYKIPVVVLPKQITEEEQINTELSNRINSEDTNSDYVKLPEEIDGKKVIFYEKKKKILPYFFAMFLIIAFLIYYYKIYNPKITKEKRDKLLIADYPEIVSKLSLLMGAGMSTYNALIKITEDYKKTGKTKPAYELLYECLNRISSGITETDAYMEFGKIYNDRYRMFCNKFFYMDEQLKKIKIYMADNQYDKAENLKLDFENKLNNIISTIKRLETLLGIVGDCCTEIETRADNVKQYVTEAKDLLGDEITESFCTEMDSLKNYREILKENVCDILTFEQTLETDKAILIEMGSLVRNMSDETDYKYLMELSEGYDCDGLAINIDNFIQRKKGNNLFKSLKKLFSQGILGLVLPEGDTISGRHISQTKLPSTYITGSDKDYYKHDNNTTTLAKDIIYGEYVMDNFNSYTDKKEGTVLNYEVEYIINGEQYDAANLYETVKKIAAIRSVGNFACIMTDHEKRKQAEELAEITFGWTNVRPLIAAMKYVYLYMWSYAEGLADVKALLSGYKTGLIKTKDKWQVSYTDFLTLNLEIDEDAYKSGLSYEMYLRALLMLKDKTIKSSRTMDLVELWEKANGNKDFSIRNYIYGISGKILYTVKGLNKEYIYSFGQTY